MSERNIIRKRLCKICGCYVLGTAKDIKRHAVKCEPVKLVEPARVEAEDNDGETRTA